MTYGRDLIVYSSNLSCIDFGFNDRKEISKKDGIKEEKPSTTVVVHTVKSHVFRSSVETEEVRKLVL